MNSEASFRRRKLPHWDVPGQPIFLTACLFGSLPARGLQRIQEYRSELESRQRPQEMSEHDWEYRKEKLAFAFMDQLLDGESPVRHLADPLQAEIVEQAFHYFAGKRYQLFAYVVMPSHHHWLFLPNDDQSREQISHSIQSFTAHECNRVRKASGPYWQRETYDHWVRDEEELLRIIAYIENNPVKAGLVDKLENWRWSSARVRADRGIAAGEPIATVE